jgi:DNA topoisomerase II|uniref:DNA topoisomerase (ATP-hydrolyzing) n=1 Tax=viral metagenome TaxID=1070528 RepID=A0A6C0IZ90_9ZZZZ
MPPKKASQIYQKKDPIDHVLDRTDMYVGSKRLRASEEFIYCKETHKIIKKSIKTAPAILRIFVEALSNAIDNVERSSKTTKCTYINVNIDKETGRITIQNDGEIIPIEIHDEEKCYIHTMIFGQMLTGSNYNDEEERLVSGRNGLGIKLCLKKGTLIPKFDGEVVKIEDLKVGDCVIGDDGLRRNITNKCEGNGKLFEVSQARGNSYIVNENHILSLKMSDHKVIFWNTDKNGLSILWWDKENMKICSKYISASPPKVVCPECNQELCGNLGRHYKRMHKDKEVPKKTRRSPTVIPPEKPEVRQALQEMKQFAETIPDNNTIDISIKDYRKLNKTTQARLSGFVGECVEWEEQEVKLDPYVLGLWLGDGYKNGYGFAINSKDDPEILEYLEEWGKENDATFKQGEINNPVAYYISSTTKSGVAPLKKLLTEYNLIDNKHIPQEYLVNSREIRLAVLAGMIDSDGTVQSEGHRITIAQGMDHSKLASDVIFLAKSLGLMCSSHIAKTQWKYNGELRRGNAININISGDIEDIPTLVARKKCYNPLSRNVTNTGKISIQEVESGDYVGIEVDSNNRFVLEDFTVTHNCNIFSKEFSVEGVDPANKKKFVQTWTDNMKNTSDPIIKSSSLKKGYTKVSWVIDIERFGLKELTDDLISLYSKYVIDCAMLTKVKVTLNDEIMSVKNLSEYSNLYNLVSDEKIQIKMGTCEVVLTPSNTFEAISFVNGVYTKLGGQHVETWVESLLRPLVDKFNGKDKKSKTKSPKLNILDIKQFFRIFVVAQIDRPEFDSQDKNKLESPEVSSEVKKSHITAISKWSIIDKIEDIIRAKEMLVLKKSEKSSTKTKIEGYDRANKAGSKDSKNCSLYITEGLSAKTYVVCGIKEGLFDRKGRDWNGILPIRGKLLNVRDKGATVIAGNKVICSIIQALGLKHDLDYKIESNFNKLNYGKLILVADADTDGIHIEALLINFIHSLYPSLLERDESFIISLKTPIVRVKISRNKDRLFYDERSFNNWLSEQKGKVETKYYKGLGTTKAEDVPDTFGKKLVEFKRDDTTFESMQKAFHKKYSDLRKEWLGNYDPTSITFSLDNVENIHQMSITDFIDEELIKFSYADCGRSIPNGIDGMKESQRKILFAVKKRKLNYGGKSLKVAQLAGYTAEHANYHHGENNLLDTIIGMANEFPGTNNIPILYRDGQFGTRLEGGNDAANGRYIFTKMEALTEFIYKNEDEPLLKQVNDDGDLVQPEFYIPILPMILINGCVAGIGTGWSCNIPCFNPKDIICGIKTWLDYEGEVYIPDPENENELISVLPVFEPWYRGYKGSIEADGENRFISYGIIEKTGKRNEVEVKELPVGMWTSKFVDFCEDLKSSKIIKDVSNYSTPKDVKLLIKERGPSESKAIKCDYDNLKLHTYLYTSNMVVFDEKSKLNKYDSVDDILCKFCEVRYSYYVKRKEYQIDSYNKLLRFLGNKERFIKEVINEDIDVMNVEEKLIIKTLVEREYDEDPKKSDDEGGYDYLLRLPVRSFTKEKVNQLQEDILSNKKILESIQKTTEKEMWLKEIDEFEKEYDKWLIQIDQEQSSKPKKK